MLIYTKVYLVGEAVPQTVCDTWASRKTLFNMYGYVYIGLLALSPVCRRALTAFVSRPTEATCGATIARLLPGRNVTIGRPNPSTRVYILNQHRNLVPIGRIGGIWLAGVQVAQGYIGQPELTAERFHPDTICQGLGEYMYSTGDQGYWNEAGEIVFLGRTDRQVKVRGFRLDLDDLETRILGCCHESSAVALTCGADKTQLVCMIQTDNKDVAQLRAKIAKDLPTYAVPRFIIPVDTLPMTLTGKVDYKAVASGGRRDLRSEDRLETTTEAKLAAIWASLLDLSVQDGVIKPSSSFTELGGHSLHQLRLVSKLSAEFGVPVSLRTVTELPTVRSLAQEIDKLRRHHSLAAICREMPLGRYKLSPAERYWWQRYTLDRGSAAFNVSFVCRYDPEHIHRHRLVEAWNHVLARYDIFRSRYVHHRRRGVERVLSPHPPAVQKLASIDVWLELNTPFTLETAPPVRVVIGKDMVVATWSHIVCDYTTLALVLAEVAAVYRNDALQPCVPMYHETTSWNIPAPPCSVQFWDDYLKNVAHTQPAYLGNGADRTSYRGTSSTARISPWLWHRMRAYIGNGRVTAQQLAVAATALALSVRDNAMDVTLGIPFINRRSEADMNTVGLFLEPLPIRIVFCDSVGDQGGSALSTLPVSCSEYVGAVQSLAQRALSHAIPWHQLLEHLSIKPDELLPDHPLFDCVVSFHDMCSTEQSGGGAWNQLTVGPGVQPQLVWSEGSKFKLMVEFTAISDDTLILRLEYDDSCYEGAAHIAAVRRMILRVLEAVTTAGGGDKRSFEDLRGDMKREWQVEEASGFVTESSRGDEARFVAGTDGLFQASLANM